MWFHNFCGQTKKTLKICNGWKMAIFLAMAQRKILRSRGLIAPTMCLKYVIHSNLQNLSLKLFFHFCFFKHELNFLHSSVLLFLLHFSYLVVWAIKSRVPTYHHHYVVGYRFFMTMTECSGCWYFVSVLVLRQHWPPLPANTSLWCVGLSISLPLALCFSY